MKMKYVWAVFPFVPMLNSKHLHKTCFGSKNLMSVTLFFFFWGQLLLYLMSVTPVSPFHATDFTQNRNSIPGNLRQHLKLYRNVCQMFHVMHAKCFDTQWLNFALEMFVKRSMWTIIVKHVKYLDTHWLYFTIL